MTLEKDFIPKKRPATIRQTAQTYRAFTEAALRWLIFNEKVNGFSRCLIRIGRRVLIDLDAFEGWLENQTGGTK